MKKISATVVACSMVVAAQAQLIDDFSDTSLAEYTKSVVLEQSGANAVSFASPSGALQVSKTADTGAEQVLFLRGDYSLGIGQVLRIDTATAQLAGTYEDFGIAVSATVDPADAVWVSGTADVRQNYVTVYVKGQTDAIGRAGFNGTVNAGGNSGTAGVPGLPNLLGLFIGRPSADTFNVGYTTASGDTVLFAYTGMNTTIGTAVGFYADVRSVVTFGNLDNLRLEPIPEPSTLALLGLGALASVLRLRGRKQGWTVEV